MDGKGRGDTTNVVETLTRLSDEVKAEGRGVITRSELAVAVAIVKGTGVDIGRKRGKFWQNK